MGVSISSTGLNTLIKQNKKMLDSTTKTYKKSLDTSKKLIKNHEKIYKINKDMNNETLKTLKKQENSMKIMEKLSLKIKGIFATIGKMGWIALLSGAVAGLGMIFGGMNAKRNKYKNEATATEERLGMAKGTLFQEVKGRNANYIGNGLYDRYDNYSKLNGFNKVNGSNGQQLFERLFDIRRQYKEYKETGQTTEDLNNMMKYGSAYLEDLLATNDINKMIDIFKSTAQANKAYGDDILNSTLLNNTGFDYNGLMRINTNFGYEMDEFETESDNPFMAAIRWLKEEFMKSKFVEVLTKYIVEVYEILKKFLSSFLNFIVNPKDFVSKLIKDTKHIAKQSGNLLQDSLGYSKLKGKQLLIGVQGGYDYLFNGDKNYDKYVKDNANAYIQYESNKKFFDKDKQGIENAIRYQEMLRNKEVQQYKQRLSININNNDTSTTINSIKR